MNKQHRREQRLLPPLRNRQVALRLYYTSIVFYILFVTVVLIGGFFMLLVSLGVITSVRYLPIVMVCLTSICLGTLLSAYVSKRIFDPVLLLSEASKEVAKGDFSVRVSTDTQINEIRETCANFNAMVENLSAIETLSNDFVANVSHEFKTPITAIQGNAMLLQDQGLTAAEQGECVERILCNTQRLTTLVGNILTLSKIENRSSSLERQPFRLDEQIRSVIVELEPKWSAKELEPVVDLPVIIYDGAEGLLAQVWVNLLDNAVKFSPVGGQITVTAQEDKEKVTVCVGDQGPGVDEANSIHIFDKFYQADTSHKAEGNGLGLALVREIAQLHGGGVSVRNEGGALFTVELGKM